MKFVSVTQLTLIGLKHVLPEDGIVMAKHVGVK
jgi:hypothetical protein